MSEDWEWLEDMAALALTALVIVVSVACGGLLYWVFA
jgi:hypothetical protein